MGLAADALQPFIVDGLISVAGRINPMSLADVIIAPTAGYDLSVDDAKRTVLLDFREPKFITGALASDCGRFSCAAFQTISTAPGDLEDRDSFAWGLVKMYYAAFYAGHALIRIMGEGCSFFYKIHADRIAMVSDAIGIQPAFKVDAGLYHCLLSADATSISFLRAQGLVGGAHEAFWLIFGKKLKAVAEEVLKGRLPRSDAQEVFSRLDFLLEVLGRKSGYSWLSNIRNELQYRLQFGAWYPSRRRPQVREGLSRLADQWTKDPMSIDVQAAGQRYDLFGEFVACCAFVTALCRELLLRIADSSPEGERSFVRVSGPVTFLHEIGGIH